MAIRDEKDETAHSMLTTVFGIAYDFFADVIDMLSIFYLIQ